MGVMALTKLKYKRSRSDTNDENRKAPRLLTSNLNVPSTSDSRPQSSRSSRRSGTPSIFQNNNQGNQHDLYIAVDNTVATNLLETNLDVDRLAEILRQSATISDDHAKTLAEAHIKGQAERLREQQEKEEIDRINKEKEEIDRINKEKEEAERLQKEREEAERQRKEKEEAERQ